MRRVRIFSALNHAGHFRGNSLRCPGEQPESCRLAPNVEMLSWMLRHEAVERPLHRFHQHQVDKYRRHHE